MPINGAVSNLSVSTSALSVLGHELRTGGYDVVHVHEPNAPFISYFATETSPVPTVGTFHTYSTARVIGGITANIVGARRLYNKLAARIAVSEAAAWTARRYYGGRYSIVPNGVDLSAARPEPRPAGEDLEILFVGRAEGRKGLPVLLRAFEALRAAGVGARLTIAGVPEIEVQPLLLDPEGVRVVGPGGRGSEVAPARELRPALRAVAGRRELRDGAHGGLRLGHAGGGLGHRRLPRRGARRP